jgi:hypothetical protein
MNTAHRQLTPLRQPTFSDLLSSVVFFAGVPLLLLLMAMGCLLSSQPTLFADIVEIRGVEKPLGLAMVSLSCWGLGELVRPHFGVEAKMFFLFLSLTHALSALLAVFS